MKSSNNYKGKRNAKNMRSKSTKRENCRKGEENINKEEFKTNDIAWYSRYPELLRDAGSVVYSLPAGTAVPLGITDYSEFSTPGFVRNDIAMVLPFTDSADDPVNVSSVSTYIYCRRGKSGTAPYDCTDLSLLMVAMAHVYSLVNWMNRAYGLTSLYSTQNKYLPKAILEADGWDFENLVHNLANFRYGINAFIRKVGAFVLPDQSQVPLFSRYAFMFKNVYIGSANIKDQMYFNHPIGFYKYNVPTASLEFTELRSEAFTYDYILEYANNLVDTMFGDTDIATMCADISNAYGNNTISLTTLGEEYPLVPLYDYNVLQQMHNATVIPKSCIDVTSFNVTQTGAADQTPWLQCTPYTLSARSFYGDYFHNILGKGGNQLILTSTPKPSIEETVEFTRLKVWLTEHEGETTVYDIHAGTEIVVGSYIYQYSAVSHTMLSLDNSYVVWPLESFEDSHGYLKLMLAKVSTQFAPHTYVWDTFDQSIMLGVDVNIDNYALLPSTTLDNLHTTCLYSMLSLPMTNII